MDENNSPVIFCITIEEETRYYRNDDMSLNDLIQRYSECKRPFIELGETSQRIDTIQFVELEQTLGTTSIEIVPDENRVTVYENKGNDVYENELGNGFEEYKLSELLEQLEKIEITPENEKSTITVDEDDILRMSAKIQQNKSENTAYHKQLDTFFNGNMPSHKIINVCSTPNVLKLLHSTAKKIVLNQKDLENAISSKKTKNGEHTEGHNISKEEIYKLSDEIRNPIMILKGNERNKNSVVLITNIVNQNNERVFVPISLDRQNGKISNISTLYGKKNLSNYISQHMHEILSLNIEKTGLLADTGVQFSQSIYDTVTCYDNSISYSMQNVKIPGQNLQVNKEKADQVLRSNGLQLPPENTLNGSNNSVSPSNGKVNSSEKNIIENLLAEGKAEFNDDGSFKINNDYYRALPREDRTIEVVPVQHAAEIMQQLADKGIEFSAVSRKNDKAAITVHIEHKSDLTSAAEKAVKGQIQKNQPTVSKTASKEIINPDYFKQLKSSERHIQRLPSGDADRIIASLESKGIKFSAVKGEKLTSITVHKDDRAAVGQAVHENNRTAAKEYINSDYFKSLPPEQRVYSQTADLNAAKTLMNALDSEAVQYSAVIDNEKSNARITIAKEDIPKAQKTGFLFSRQAQKSFTEKAQTQNNEREATRVSEHKKENHTI